MDQYRILHLCIYLSAFGSNAAKICQRPAGWSNTGGRSHWEHKSLIQRVLDILFNFSIIYMYAWIRYIYKQVLNIVIMEYQNSTKSVLTREFSLRYQVEFPVWASNVPGVKSFIHIDLYGMTPLSSWLCGVFILD